MSSEVMENNPQIEAKSRKLAVRLRLKRSSHETSAPSEIYSVKQFLNENNIGLANNNENICKMQIQPLSLSFKKCVECVSAYFQKQEKVKNVVICKVVKKFKEQLKFIHKQLDNILRRPQLHQFQKKLQQKSNEQQEDQQKLLKTLQLMQSQNLDISQQNARMSQTNKQLKYEVMEMQQYIIQLKQKLNQKQNKVFELQDEVKDKENQLYEKKYELVQNGKLLAVLQEEIAGYENKIQQLQSELAGLRNFNRSAVVSNSRDSAEEEFSLREGTPNVSKSEDQSSFLTIGKQKDNRTLKLQEIYSKTEEALKKYRLLEEEMELKEAQYSESYEKMRCVLENFNLSTLQEFKTLGKIEFLQKVEKNMEEKMNKIRQEYIDRETKLQSMISQQLDKALKVIESHMSNLGPIPSHFTILDKIQYLSEVMQYSVLAATYPSENTGQEILQSLQQRLQQIMNKSEQFKKQLTENNKTLTKICQKYEESPQLNMQTYQKLQQIQQLLVTNQQILEMEIIQKQGQRKQNEMMGSRNSAKSIKSVQMNEYLEELQATIRKIEKNQNHQICNQEKDKLRFQIKELLKFNQNLTFKIQQVIRQLSAIKDDEDVQAIERQLSLINSKLKESSTVINKDVFQASNQAFAFERFNFQLENNKKKYYQQGVLFIQALMQRLKQIKQSLSEEKFYDICDRIFQQIQQKDENLKQQIGRRRQLLKQRTAVIAQICKQGMRDSSCENSMRQSK